MGHAIVSVEGAIAGADGRMPAALQNAADWAHFQTQLGASALTVLGRLGHEQNPNNAKRHRLVFSSRGRGLEYIDELTHRINPKDVPIPIALSKLVPQGGNIAVVGGTAVFDVFLDHGFDTFHFAVAGQASLPGGRPVFSGVTSAADAEARLVGSGLELTEVRTLDPGEDVGLKIYSRK